MFGIMKKSLKVLMAGTKGRREEMVRMRLGAGRRVDPVGPWGHHENLDFFFPLRWKTRDGFEAEEEGSDVSQDHCGC